MKSDVFIQQEVAAGSPVHCHQGVWWKTTARGVCRPLLFFQEIVPKTARPRLYKSLVGYAHLVPKSLPTPRRAFYWVMEEAQLRNYSLENLSYSIRKHIYRARRNGLTVERVMDLEPFWDDLRAIAMSKSERTGYGRPAHYYQTRFEQWCQSLKNEFSRPGREWWGVFLNGKLGGYLYGYFIADTMYLRVYKVHSDFLRLNASYLLYFSVLEYCRDLPGCVRVNAGRGGQMPGVDQFQQKQGFEKAEVGEYFAYRWWVKVVLWALKRFPQPAELDGALPRGERRGRLQTLYRHAHRMANRINSQEAG